MRYVKIFGARRTATNYLTVLLPLNFDVEIVKGLSFKHNAPTSQFVEAMGSDSGRFNKDSLCAIVLAKHPYPWILSRARFGSIKKIELGRHRPLLEEFIINYNSKYKIWLDFIDKFSENTSLVRYEDLINRPKKTALGLMRTYGWKLKKSRYRDIKQVVAPGEIIKKNRKFNKFYYTQKRYLEELSPDFRKFLNKKFDWGIAGKMGYKPE